MRHSTTVPLPQHVEEQIAAIVERQQPEINRLLAFNFNVQSALFTLKDKGVNKASVAYGYYSGLSEEDGSPVNEEFEVEYVDKDGKPMEVDETSPVPWLENSPKSTMATKPLGAALRELTKTMTLSDHEDDLKDKKASLEITMVVTYSVPDNKTYVLERGFTKLLLDD